MPQYLIRLIFVIPDSLFRIFSFHIMPYFPIFHRVEKAFLLFLPPKIGRKKTMALLKAYTMVSIYISS